MLSSKTYFACIGIYQKLILVDTSQMTNLFAESLKRHSVILFKLRIIVVESSNALFKNFKFCQLHTSKSGDSKDIVFPESHPCCVEVQELLILHYVMSTTPCTNKWTWHMTETLILTKHCKKQSLKNWLKAILSLLYPQTAWGLLITTKNSFLFQTVKTMYSTM